MGGVFFPVAVVTALVWSGFVVGRSKSCGCPAVCALTLGYAAIGWLDDWQILLISPIRHLAPMKLALQIGFAALFCLWLAQNQSGKYHNRFTLWDCSSLRIAVLALGCVCACGESNATNNRWC